MDTLLVVNKADQAKWDLLRRIDERTLESAKLFKPHDNRLYVALLDGGLIVAGDNSKGLLGLGHRNTVKTFEEIATLRGKSIKDIACGRAHVLVLTEAGQVWAWGENRHGQVGVEDEQYQLVPKLIIDKNVVMIKCGYAHSLALMHDGRVVGWGWNEGGRVGVKDNSRDRLPPTTVLTLKDDKIVLIETGPCHSVAVSATGRAYGWGWNGQGQLGLEGREEQHTPALLNVDNKAIKAVACSWHSTLFLSEDGLLYTTRREDTMPRRLRVDGSEKCKYVVSLGCSYSGVGSFPDELFVAWTCSGRMFYWGDSRQRARAEPFETDCSITEIVSKHYKHNTFSLSFPLEQPDVTTTGVVEFIPDRTSLAAHLLEQIFDSPDNYDVEYVFEGNKTIRVHRSILSAASPHLSTELSTTTTWPPNAKVAPRDFSYDIYYLYLAYLYTIPLPSLALDQLTQLLQLAHTKHEVLLQQECVDHITEHLNLDTCCRVFEIAADLDLGGLEAQALEIIRQNIFQVKTTNGFKQMKPESLKNCFSKL